jgi:hypothetical protein
VPKAAWHCGGDSSVANDHFRAPGSTPSYVWGSAGGDCLIPRVLWDKCGPQEIYRKNGEGFGEFKFRRFGKYFYGLKRL